jgi:hypothetical protein
MTMVGSCKYRGSSGILTISGGNLIFTRQDKGLFSSKEVVGATIPANAIISMNVESGGVGGLFSKTKKLVVMVDSQKVHGIPRHEFEVSDPYHFMKVIQNEMDSQHIREESKNRPTKEVIREREIVRIPCKYCGSLNENTAKKCSNCGAVIGD